MCKKVQNIRTTVNFYATGQLSGHKHLMPALRKANCAFPGPDSEKEEDRASKYHGGNEIPNPNPKECGKHLSPPHKPLEWTGLALQ